MSNSSSESALQPDAAADTGGASSNLPDRKARLAALKARRSIAIDERDPAEAKRPRVALAQRAQIASERGGPQQGRKQVVMRVYRLLTRTPDDGSGMVPGTPFTRAGVSELMIMLHERAANEGAPGAKAARNAIGFLKVSEDDEEAIAGASIAKLQTIARLALQFGMGR